MQIGSELVRGVGHIALRKKRIAMGGFINILDNQVASMRGELFELMDGLVCRVRLTGRGICPGALSPDGAERCVAGGLRHSRDRTRKKCFKRVEVCELV